MNQRRHAIAATFGQAAHHYAQQADLQRYAAGKLADKLPALQLPPQPKVLELGCGSGLLSHYLLKHRPEGRFLFTDLSYAMITTARQQLIRPTTGHSALWFAVMDGEQPAIAPGFDLITAGLTWQWFMDPLKSFNLLVDLLNPGGWLLFSTLGEQTFHEWRTACQATNLPCGAMNHPNKASWEKQWSQREGQGFIHEEIITTRHESALEFLQSLHAIGANLPIPTHHPLTGGALRRLLRQQQHPFFSSYHLFYIVFGKQGGL